MKPLTFLLIAGDPSGDLAATDLVRALKDAAGPVPPRFLGAGGPAMKAAGVDLLFELTGHSVIGLEILKRLRYFRKVFQGLLKLAEAETPDAIIGVDYAGLNLRFAMAVRKRLQGRHGQFRNWRPHLIQYISPQVWASRPGRARLMERTHDLLLSILPFESTWFARHAPSLKVVFVGHPLVDRRSLAPSRSLGDASGIFQTQSMILLPGSREGELRRHLPVMVPAAIRVGQETGVPLKLVVAEERLREVAASFLASSPQIQLQVGRLDNALREATVALASTGTVTLECAWFGVPTVALYKTSPLTYQVGRRIITVRHLAMPNLLAGETVIPEFIQNSATPESLANAVIELLKDEPRRAVIRQKLLSLAQTLGPPGTSERAAHAILDLF